MERFFVLALALVMGLAPTGAADDAPHGPPPPSDPRFEFLERLAGTWVGEPHHEGMPTSVFEFRVTSGGHAIEEREMVGTPMEMLTVYSMDGEDLVATHYCMLGNQPRATAAKRVVESRLDFGCSGTPGNSASHADKHVHGWSMALDDDGRLHYSGELVEGGRTSEKPAFVLTRQARTASR